MKIKIFNEPYMDGSMQQLESKVNSFIAGKSVVQIEQTAVNKGVGGMAVLITVLYNDH